MWWELPAALGLGGSGFAAWGNRGQAVAVIPSRRLVVAQTADRTDGLIEISSSDFVDLLRLIVDAAPGSR